MFDLKMHAGGGSAHPVFASDFYPAALDSALGAINAREAWETANADGTAAELAYREAAREWSAKHPPTDYPDPVSMGGGRPLFDGAYAQATRDHRAAVNASTIKSKAALTAYHDAQIAGFAAARGSFAEAWLDADKRAVDAMKIVDAAVLEREALMRYICVPERSAQPGKGHWMHASALGANRKSPTAQYQRDDMTLVVNVAPRDIVKAHAAALAAKAAR